MLSDAGTLPGTLGRRSPRLRAMSEPSLQRRYAPDSRCFGCGPANARGPADREPRGRRHGPGELRRRLAAAPPSRGVRRRPQRRDHRDAARLPRELDRRDAADARARPGRSARLRDGRLRDPPAPPDTGRPAGPAARLAGLGRGRPGRRRRRTVVRWHHHRHMPRHVRRRRSRPSRRTSAGRGASCSTRFFASEASADDGHRAAAAPPPSSDPTGDTATVRRIVAKLEAMPPEQARLIASAAYTLARAANADLDISDEETAAIERELQARRVDRRGDRRPRHRDGQAPGEDRRRDRGLRRDPRVQGAGRRGAAARRPAGLLRGRGRQRHDLGRGDRDRQRDRRGARHRRRDAQRDPRRLPRAVLVGPGQVRRISRRAPDAGGRGRQARRRSTRPSPSRRRTSASSSAS